MPRVPNHIPGDDKPTPMAKTVHKLLSRLVSERKHMRSGLTQFVDSGETSDVVSVHESFEDLFRIYANKELAHALGIPVILLQTGSDEDPSVD